jgi:peptidoglycan/xylan/chitin deacetylase (PgdA/CDA1 family)
MTSTTREAPPTVPILMYHSIATTSNPRYRRFAVSQDLLREHLDHLADHDWKSMTVSEYVSSRSSTAGIPPKVVLLTFDDAFSDFFTQALPLLQERGFTATLFVPAGGVGSTSQWMTFEGETMRPLLDWAQLRDVAACGVECGSHSYTHPELDRLPPWRLAAELRRSREVLEQELQREIRAFAYPYGYHDARIRRETKASGYQSACAVGNAPAVASDDPLALPRLTVPGGTTRRQFRHLMATPRNELRVRGERVKAMTWRTARRCGLEEAVLQRVNR